MLEIGPSQLQQSGHASSRDLELAVKLTIPDRQVELLMSAMQADLEAGSPAGSIYGESLGNTLGNYLVKRHGVFASKLEEHKGGLPKPRLNRVLEYVDQHLEDNVSLTALAEVAGLSMYHFAKAFNRALGHHRISTFSSERLNGPSNCFATPIGVYWKPALAAVLLIKAISPRFFIDLSVLRPPSTATRPNLSQEYPKNRKS